MGGLRARVMYDGAFALAGMCHVGKLGAAFFAVHRQVALQGAALGARSVKRQRGMAVAHDGLLVRVSGVGGIGGFVGIGAVNTGAVNTSVVSLVRRKVEPLDNRFQRARRLLQV